MLPGGSRVSGYDVLLGLGARAGLTEAGLSHVVCGPMRTLNGARGGGRCDMLLGSPGPLFARE